MMLDLGEVECWMMLDVGCVGVCVDHISVCNSHATSL